MAFWGFPDGSKTSANSASGAVPDGCVMDVKTMKRWRREQMVMGV